MCERELSTHMPCAATFYTRAKDVCAQQTVYQKFKLIWFKTRDFSAIDMIIKTKHMFFLAVTHIAIFLWPSSGPHNQLSLGPHTAMTYGPSVDQVWSPDKSHTWAITGPIQGQLWVINLAKTWASYGPCVALVWIQTWSTLGP